MTHILISDVSRKEQIKNQHVKSEPFGSSHCKKYVPLLLINCNKRTLQLLDTIMNHDAFEMTTEINPLSRRHDTVDNLTIHRGGEENAVSPAGRARPLTVDIDQQMTALLWSFAMK